MCQELSSELQLSLPRPPPIKVNRPQKNKCVTLKDPLAKLTPFLSPLEVRSSINTDKNSVHNKKIHGEIGRITLSDPYGGGINSSSLPPLNKTLIREDANTLSAPALKNSSKSRKNARQSSQSSIQAYHRPSPSRALKSSSP